jgi:TRAP-type C4-dicarboxylate transport system permease small subunit
MVPDSEKPPAGGLFARVEDLFATLSQWALAVLLALVVVQIVTRYVLNGPLGEVVSITETYLMPAMVFFAIAALQRHDGHIRVDLLYVVFKGRTKQVIDLIILVASAAFWIFVIYASATETLFSLRMDYEVSRTLPFPQWTALVVVPLGGALILIRLLLQSVSTVMAMNQPLPQETAP